MSALFKFSTPEPIERTAVVLGLDGGGTKTEVLIADLVGTILASHVGGPTNLAAISELVATDNLEAALSAAFKGLRHVEVQQAVFGVAGIDAASDLVQFHRLADPLLASFGVHHFQLFNDSEIALANGTMAAEAMIVISGTGSIAYGHNANGVEVRAGGMDFLLADEGSGYWIGCKVLQAVVRADDGRGQPTALTPLVLKHFGISAVEGLKEKVYQPLLSKMEIAELAKIWEVALKQDDEVAKEILALVVDELVMLVQAVARALGFSTGSFDLVLAGSIAQLGVVVPPLRARLLEQYPQIKIIVPETTPAHGAVKLALKAIESQVV